MTALPARRGRKEAREEWQGATGAQPGQGSVIGRAGHDFPRGPHPRAAGMLRAPSIEACLIRKSRMTYPTSRT